MLVQGEWRAGKGQGHDLTHVAWRDGRRGSGLLAGFSEQGWEDLERPRDLTWGLQSLSVAVDDEPRSWGSERDDT